MQSHSSETKIGDQSFAAFVNQVKRPPEFISDGSGISMTEAKYTPSISFKKETSEVSESNERKDDLFEPEKRVNPIESSLKEAKAKPTEFKEECLPDEQDSPFMNSFLLELVQSIKNSLTSISHVTLLTSAKVEDGEMRKHSQAQIKEEIKKVDLLLNSLSNFITVNTPVARTNNLYTILEEILEANEKNLQEKNIKVIKRLEKDLPETYIHNEQVRFVLHSILQYAIFSTPPNRSIGLLMKSLNSHEGMDANKTFPENKAGYVEMVIGFDSDRKLGSQLKALSEIPGDQREEANDLILKLVKQTLHQNHGKMVVETNGKRPNTLITLRFPKERRNVVYYAPITL